MTLTQKEAFQSVVNRFPNHTIELNNEWIVLDGKQIQIHWTVDEETWNSSYCGIPAAAELEAMLYEVIYFRVNGKMLWEEEHD